MAAAKANAGEAVKLVTPEGDSGETSEVWGEVPAKLGFKSSSGEEGETIWLLSYADMMTLLFAFFVMISSFSKIDTDDFERMRLQSTQFFGGDFKKSQQALQKELKDKVQMTGFADEAFFEELEKGIAITFRGSTFFDSASAEIRADARELLNRVIPAIKKQPEKYSVVIEGHTDDSPIATEKFPSNWELSSQRAATVLRAFETAGFDRNHLRAIGFADTVPVLPNRLSDNTIIKENQAQNRRVIIKLIRRQ